MYSEKKIAIIGASYLQNPLILKAKSLGLETHVFSWGGGEVGEKTADHFYQISITKKEKILEVCRAIRIDGICSISSDLANITVSYVAEHMGLTSNSIHSTLIATNKSEMRKAFLSNGDPSPKSIVISSIEDLCNLNISYPIIVKPLDRSGSRGITKLETPEKLINAYKNAIDQGFIKSAIIEEYVLGKEFSVEYISYNGKHTFLSLTEKYTTGSPNFVETGHLEPAHVNESLLSNIKNVVEHALDSLEIMYGASHSELKVDNNGNITIIEIGSRMGGDFIGSNLVQLTTGFDFVKGVIDVALGIEPTIPHTLSSRSYAAVRFILTQDDINVYNKIVTQNPSIIKAFEIPSKVENLPIRESSERLGYFILSSADLHTILRYMPADNQLGTSYEK